MEQSGKEAKNLAESEEVIIEQGRGLLGTAFGTLAEEREGISPLKCPCGKELGRSIQVESLWGKVEVPHHRYRCSCGHHQMRYADASLDESGWMPQVLKRLHDTCTQVS